ncbi:MAG: fumarylacetoacetate hydrolase family protein [Chloroflexia bacterium]|nr:fumarylacetoacetate hydrolase family protein [Chloroflexia bacterium]
MPLCCFQLGSNGGQTRLGWVDSEKERVFELSHTLASLLALDGPARLARIMQMRRSAVGTYPLKTVTLRAPVDQQEVWAAGVTYKRSRDARIEESTQQDVYEKVYDAKRPEIFFKANGWRCVGQKARVGIRHDSNWDVPEPELTLVLDSSGKIAGYTIGNNVSSRSIEGENPLYLSQAKMFYASCAIGPWIMLPEELEDVSNLAITVSITRSDEEIWSGQTSTSEMHRSFEDLIAHLYASLDFPHGALLMTGTGLVPPARVTLQSGDQVTIGIEGIGSLTNSVARLSAR